MPSMKAMGTNTITSTAVVAMTAKPTSRVPCQAAIKGIRPLQVVVDVLHHHDGVIHHQADGEDEGQQGDEVDGKAQIPGTDEGRNEGDGHRDGGMRVVRPCPRKR